MATITESIPDNNARRNHILRISALVGLALLAAFAARYYFVAFRPYETTDDAFIDGHAIPISLKVGGHVTQLPATDNQRVNQGDVLLQIDPRDYELRLEVARANLAAARSRQAQALSLVTVAEAQAAQDHAAVAAAAAEARRAQADLERYQAVEKRAISQQQLDSAVAAEQATTATLAVAQKKAAMSDAQISLAKSQIVVAETGTAQAVGIGKDQKYDAHKIEERQRDHALYTAFAPADDPKIVIAMVVENAGFGAEHAAPIARRVLDYWLLGQYPNEEDMAAVSKGQAAAPIGKPLQAADVHWPPLKK